VLVGVRCGAVSFLRFLRITSKRDTKGLSLVLCFGNWIYWVYLNFFGSVLPVRSVASLLLLLHTKY
jgi:hypothetical protein